MLRVKNDAYGASCVYGNTTVRLDPRTAGPGVNFVSHAHYDHLPASCNGSVLTSGPTALLAQARGRSLGEHREGMEGVEMRDSGHILGSRSLLVGDVFYTGDICTRTRGFLAGARVPRCDVMVTECTFGLPEFSFPPVREVRARVDELVGMLYSRGVPVILMGYELGKAQLLSQMFAHWEPMYHHDSVRRMNDAHRMLGAPVPDAPGHTQAARAGLLERRPWVMVAPVLGAKSRFLLEMRRYGAVTVSFSGWAASKRFPRRGADYSVPLSDHCDFNELVDMVERSGASQVYTVHGFVEEFAASLAERGISAEPLASAAAAR